MGGQKTEHERIVWLANINKRGAIALTNYGILFAGLWIGPTPNIVASKAT